MILTAAADYPGVDRITKLISKARTLAQNSHSSSLARLTRAVAALSCTSGRAASAFALNSAWAVSSSFGRGRPGCSWYAHLGKEPFLPDRRADAQQMCRWVALVLELVRRVGKNMGI
jgi:hypothetical protein